jgi:hypothetical protein
MGRALALADGLVDGLPPRPALAEALVRRAQLEDEDVEAGEALLVRALEDAGGDELLRGRVLDQLGWLRGVFRGDLSAGIACARQALAVAESLGDREFEMSAAAGLSNMETLAGTPRPDLIDQLEDGRFAGAAAADQRQRLAAVDREVEAGQHRRPAVAVADAVELDDRHLGHRHFGRGLRRPRSGRM